MKIISFSWTAPALIAGHKTVTRREWRDTHAAKFHKGDFVQAYDKSPAFGGRQIAIIQLTDNPYQEWSANCVEWHAEGLGYLADMKLAAKRHTPEEIWADWMNNPRMLWVVRFKVVFIGGQTG